MERNKSIVAVLGVCALLAVTGCEKKEETPASKSATAAVEKADDAASKVKSDTGTAAAKADADAAKTKSDADAAATKIKADADADAAKAKTDADAAAAKISSDAAKAKTEADAAASKAKESADAAAKSTEAAANDNVAKAKSLIEKIVAFIKEKKLDEAASSLKDLDAIKASLPESMQKQVKDTHTAFDAAKAADGLKGLMK